VYALRASDDEDSNVDYEPKRWEIYRRIKGSVSDRPRLGIVLDNILLMSFAWAFYYATQWLVVRLGSNNKQLIKGHSTVNEMLLDLIVAILVSILGGLGLHRAADNVHHVSTDNEDETSIRAVLRAIALLVGFAWEQSFDITVDIICEHICDGWGKFVVITFVVGMLMTLARALPREMRSKLEVDGGPPFVSL